MCGFPIINTWGNSEHYLCALNTIFGVTNYENNVFN